MGKFRYIIILMLVVNFAIPVRANLVGSPSQNFNPIHSEQDFVTVQSAHTLPEGKVNFVYFADYAKDTLFSVNNSDRNKDSTLFSTFAFGYGLTEKWDVGMVLPYVLYQDLANPNSSGRFDEKGLVDFRLSTKYQFTKAKNSCVALVANFGFNRTENIPFYGDELGSSISLELVMDQSWKKWLFGLNIGYRHFNPGEQDGSFTAFEPLTSAIIASGAARYRFSTKWFGLGEIWSGFPQMKFDGSLNRSKNSFEFLLGGLYKKKLANDNQIGLSFGLTTQLNNGLSTPLWRAFAGGSYTFGFGSNTSSNSKSSLTRHLENEFDFKKELNLKDLNSISETSDEKKQNETTTEKDQTVSGLANTRSTVTDSEVVRTALSKAQKNSNEEALLQDKSDFINFMQDTETEDVPKENSEKPTVLENRNSSASSIENQSQKEIENEKNNSRDKSSEAIKTQEIERKESEQTLSEVSFNQKNKFEIRKPSSEELNIKTLEKLSVENIHFAFDSAELHSSSFSYLKKLAENLKEEGFQQLTIEGHTDSVGSDDYNQQLSQNRAKAVLKYLQTQGLDTTKISIKGYGETRPLASNATAKEREKNRRVEFKIQR